MSQNTPFGTPLDPEMPPIDTPPQEPESGRGRGRTIAIASGATAALVVAGVAAWVLIGDSGTEESPVVGLPSPRPSATASLTPTTSSPEVSVLPTNVVVNARNPFLRAPSPAASGDAAGGAGGAGGAVSVRTVVKTRVITEVGPTATVLRTATIRSTATSTANAVYLALFAIDAGAGNEATFRVAGNTGTKLYTATVGTKFGESDEFTYTATKLVDSVTCATVTYVEDSFTICPGDLTRVH